MGVVLAMISPASGETDGPLSIHEMPVEVIIKEFTSIITIKADGGKGVLPQYFLFARGTSFTFSPDSPLFGPAGCNIDTIKGEGEHSHHGLAAMGHGIGLQETRTRFIPLVGLDWKLFSQQGSRLCCGTAFFSVLDSGVAEHPSMVAGEIVNKALEISLGSSPDCCWYPDSHRGRMTASRLEQGRFRPARFL